MFDIHDADILVVDDNTNNLKLLIEMLKGIGYRVRAAIDGKTALIAIQNRLPDLILLDINMPDMNGYQVAEQLQNNNDTSMIPIIFISALDDTESIVEAFNQRGVDYVTKPFQFEEVAARVRTHLQLYFQHQQLIYFHQRDREQLDNIRRSEERYRDLFDNASEIIQSVDKDGHFIYANRQWHTLLAYSPDEIKTIKFADIIHPEHRDRCLKIFKDILKHPDTIQNIDTVFISKGGENVVVQGNINCSYVPDQGFHTRGIFRDITKQRAAEKRAIQFILERERLEMISDFIRDSSHELRTPLSMVSQQLYFIKRMTNEQRQLDKVAIAESKIEEVNVIITQLHEFVSLNTQQNIDIDKIDPGKLIKSCISALEEQANRGNIQLTQQIDDNLLFIAGNYILLRQALDELVRNSIRYAGQNSQIIIQAIKFDNKFISIVVEDNGPGIDPDYHTDVFKPLFKINKARTANHSGAGLGLSIVKRIVELHDGYKELMSEPGKGTRIQLILPVHY